MPACASGCLNDDETPRLAEDGSQVCSGCERRVRDALRQLPEMWEDLAGTLRGCRPSAGPRGSEPPDPIHERAIELRSAIKAHLVSWCRILEEEHGVTLPVEEAISARTRAMVLAEQQAADAAWVQIAPGTTRCDYPEWTRHQKRAQLLRASRETGADIIAALADHVSRQLLRILATEIAPILVSDFVGTAREARAVAYPSRALTVQCDCGRRVVIDPDRATECRGCGEWGDAEWWQRRLQAAESVGPMRLRELPDWLLLRGIQVGWETVRSWADTGVISEVVLPEPRRPGLPRLYDPNSVYLIALTRR